MHPDIARQPAAGTPAAADRGECRRVLSKVFAPHYRVLRRNVVAVKRNRALIESYLRRPHRVEIETVAACNARCVMCPIPAMSRPRGIMPEELYRKVIDELVPLAPKEVCPFNDGEPFLDKNILSRIAYLNERIPQAKVILYTNASLLTPRIILELSRLKIARISISFNAARKETYERVMVGLNYEEVLKNVDALIEGMKGTGTDIYVSFLKLDQNRGESMLFRRMWWGKPVEVGIWKRMDFGGHVKLPIEQRIRRALDFALPPNPCTRALNTMSILWDGRAAICCRDYEGEVLLGNVGEASVERVWNSEAAWELRWKHLEGHRGEIEICRFCPGYDDRVRTPSKRAKKLLKRAVSAVVRK